MKKCPFCWEKIQNEAKKCRFCWERIKIKEEKKEDIKEHHEEKQQINKNHWHIKNSEKNESAIEKVDIFENIKSFFFKYIRFQKQKRISRKWFWMMFLVFIIWLLFAALISASNSDLLMMLSFIIYLGLLVLLVEKAIKRAHDIWMWMSLIYVMIAAIVAMWVLWREVELNNVVLFLQIGIWIITIYIIWSLFLKKSIAWENKYGAQPKL